MGTEIVLPAHLYSGLSPRWSGVVTAVSIIDSLSKRRQLIRYTTDVWCCRFWRSYGESAENRIIRTRFRRRNLVFLQSQCTGQVAVSRRQSNDHADLRQDGLGASII